MASAVKVPAGVLVIDVGGSNVKLLMAGGAKRKFKSGRAMTPKAFVIQTKELTKDWRFDAIAMGFPAPGAGEKILIEPANLGKGWKGFDPGAALGKPAKVVNDAAMQALGSYKGGRMLFLGLGTGLGSALVLEGTLLPLELCELHYSRSQTLEDVLGKAHLKDVGVKEWEGAVHEIVAMLQRAFLTDYVVLGGGNVKKLKVLPKGARAGRNDNAYLGGVRLWQKPSTVAAPKPSQTRSSAAKALRK